jgi:septal ring factor EnvC (AmiA/AmiB activator)
MQRARPNAPRHDTARCGRLSALPLSLLLLSAGPGSPLSALAQTPPAAGQTAAASPDAIKQREQELDAARTEQNRTTESQFKLKDEIAAIGQDRSQLNQQLIDTAAQVRDLEGRMTDAEARLSSLDSREQEIRSSLKSRRSEIVEVLAALQRAGRRTPPALLVRPEDALKSLRTAILLGAVVPELRSRAQNLASELGELVALRKTIASERDHLTVDRDRMKVDQTRLAALID